MKMGRYGVISGISVSHSQASVEEISNAGEETQQQQVTALLSRDGVTEAFALQTCNRSEAYVVHDGPAPPSGVFGDFAPSIRDEAITELGHEQSLRHLMRVSAGLESLVVGEDQILGQVKDAIEDARGVGGIGPTLDEALTKAVHVGELVRTNTAINDGIVSLGSAAVEKAADCVDLGNASVLVVGAGEMGTIAAKAFDNHDVNTLIIANRSLDRAREVATLVDVETAVSDLSTLPQQITASDVVITTTASNEPLLDESTVAWAGETTIIDIAQPRDVTPAVESLPTITVYDLDTLESITEQTRNQRREAATKAEGIIDRELNHLLERYKRKRADEVIAAMYEGANMIKQREVSRAISALSTDEELSPDQQAAIEDMADALVNKLLAAPTRSLREAAAEDDWATIHTALELFDPGFEGDGFDMPDTVEEELPPIEDS